MVCRRADDRVLNGLDERVSDRSAVEPLRAEMRDALVRLGERGIREHGPDVSRSSVRIEEQRRARRDVVEPVAIRVHLVEPHLVDDVSVARDVNRRREDLGQRHRAVLLERVGPRLHRAGHADRETAVARVVEGQGASVFPERRRMHRHRRRLPSVDRRDPAAGGADDHEAAAADSARERLGDAQDGRRRDRGVHGVPAAAEDADRGLGRELLHRRGSAAGTDCGGRPGAASDVCGRRYPADEHPYRDERGQPALEAHRSPFSDDRPTLLPQGQGYKLGRPRAKTGSLFPRFRTRRDSDASRASPDTRLAASLSASS